MPLVAESAEWVKATLSDQPISAGWSGFTKTLWPSATCTEYGDYPKSSLRQIWHGIIPQKIKKQKIHVIIWWGRTKNNRPSYESIQVSLKAVGPSDVALTILNDPNPAIASNLEVYHKWNSNYLHATNKIN